MPILSIAVFGVVGILARYGVDQWFSKSPSVFPWSIFLINVFGSFLAGLLYATGIERHHLNSTLLQGLMMGFCGGFTTFSTYSLQSFALLLEGHFLTFGLYFFASPLCVIASAILGVMLGRAI